MESDRYCTNCRAILPARAEACSACGVFAGDVFDGRMPRQRRPRGWMVPMLVVLMAACAAAFVLMRGSITAPRLPWRSNAVRVDTAPIRVVNRPGGARRGAGAAITEPEAILALRHFIAESPNRKEAQADCVVVMSRGYRDGAYLLDAYDHCEGTRLGRWNVDGQTKRVSRAMKQR